MLEGHISYPHIIKAYLIPSCYKGISILIYRKMICPYIMKIGYGPLWNECAMYPNITCGYAIWSYSVMYWIYPYSVRVGYLPL